MRKEKKEQARSLYVNGKLNRKEIASIVQVTELTLRRWIEDNGWDDLKEAHTVTRQQLLADAYKQLKAINKKIDEDMNGIPNKELSDAKGVIRKEIETLSSSPLHLYTEIFTDFIEWLMKRNFDLAKTVSSFQLEFLDHKIAGESLRN